MKNYIKSALMCLAFSALGMFLAGGINWQLQALGVTEPPASIQQTD
ncbi:MAG: hypothetical protein ACFB0D_16280 [Phormidesmis sp.]